MTTLKNHCTAKKTSRHGTTYQRHGDGWVRCTIWPLGTMWCVRFERAGYLEGQVRISQEDYPNRSAAMLTVGEWLDPDQDDRYILDNDNAYLQEKKIELRSMQDIKIDAWADAI